MEILALSSLLEMTTSKANTSELGKEFERLRVEAGVSQRKAAKLLGVDQAAVSSFETGRTEKPRIGLAKYKALMRDWERALGVKVSSDSDRVVNCRDCNDETPIIFRGRRVICCVWCGEDLGRECPKCQRLCLPDAEFCDKCRTPLTDAADTAAYEARKAVEKAQTPKADRVDAIQKQARKRGEPDY